MNTQTPTNLIVIVGPPGAGKTTLAARLKEQNNAYVIHSDDFIERGEEALVSRIQLAIKSGGVIMVEGCWSVRVLTRLVTLDIIPTTIIKMETPLDICTERYEQREQKPYPKGTFGMVHSSFDKWLEWLPWQLRNHIDIQTVG